MKGSKNPEQKRKEESTKGMRWAFLMLTLLAHKVLPTSLFRATTLDPRPKNREKEEEKKKKQREALIASERNRPRFHTYSFGRQDKGEIDGSEVVEGDDGEFPEESMSLPRTKTFRLCDKFGSTQSKVFLIRTIRDGTSADFVLRMLLPLIFLLTFSSSPR